MNTSKKNIILVLVVGLILSVNYAALADGEITEESTESEESTKEVITIHDTEEELFKENVEEEKIEQENIEEEKTDQENVEEEKTDQENIAEGKNSLNTKNTKEIKSEDDTVNEVKSKDLKLNSMEREVSSWEEFSKAFNDESVKKVILIKDLIDGSKMINLDTRSTSIEIIGNGMTLDTKNVATAGEDLFSLGIATSKENFSVRDIKVRHQGGSVVKTNNNFQEAWNVRLENVEITKDSRIGSLLSGNNINEIVLKGTVSANADNWLIESENADLSIEKAVLITNRGIRVHNIKILDNSEIEISNNSKTSLEDQGIVAETLKIIGAKLNLNTTGNSIVSTDVSIKDSIGTLVSNQTVIDGHVDLSRDKLEKESFENAKKPVRLSIEDSKLKIKSVGNNKSSAIYLGSDETKKLIKFEIKGAESNVEIYSNKKYQETPTVYMGNDFRDVSDETPNSGVEVLFGATLEIHSIDGPALSIRIPYRGVVNSIFDSSILISQKVEDEAGYPVIEINEGLEDKTTLYSGVNSSFIVKSSSLKSPVLELRPTSNVEIIAVQGGTMKLLNEGEALNVAETNEVGSVLNILSDEKAKSAYTRAEIMTLGYGSKSALYMISNNGNVIKGKGKIAIDNVIGGYTEIVGDTSKFETPIIDVLGLDIDLEDAMYLNLENRRDGGGLILSSLDESSTLNASNYSNDELATPLSVWKHGSDLDGEPSKFWSKMDFTLAGKNLELIKKTSDENDFNTNDDSFGSKGFASYSRISMNNAKPIIDFSYDSFDTDKSIYGHVTVPEGLSESRNAWDGEVQLEVERVEKDETKTVYDGITTKKSKGQSWGYEDYKVPKEKWGGYFKINLEDFATAQDKYVVTSAYRGQKNQEEDRLIHSEFTENEVSQKIIIDKTPPAIAFIDEPVFENQISMSGKTSEKDIVAKLYNKDEREIKDKDGKSLEVNDIDGVWEFDVSNTDLKKDDEIYVVLKDKNGNFNPFQESTYHDATFEAAASITIRGPRFEISAKDLFTNQKGILSIGNKDNLKNEMGAQGKDNLNHNEIEVEISDLDGLEFEQREKINEVKSHKITFTLKGQDTTIVKSVHILPHDNIAQNEMYIIGASDFYTNKKDINANEDRIIELANAKAYKKEDMSNQTVCLKDAEELQLVFDKPNKINFEVKEDKDVVVDVIGRVFDYDHVNNSDQYVVAANDFNIMDYLAVDIKNKTILDRSKAVGWKIDDWSMKDVQVTEHNVKGIEGAYTATIDIVESEE